MHFIAESTDSSEIYAINAIQYNFKHVLQETVELQQNQEQYDSNAIVIEMEYN